MRVPLSRLKWRHFWLMLHLYLGLIAGFVFVIAGLTGSILVFYNEIDELLNTELIITDPNPSPSLPYEKIVQTLHDRFPERGKPWRLEIPRNSHAMLMARYYKPDETEHLHFAPLIVWIDPYTAEIVSTRIWGEYLMTWLYDLHYTLLLDLTGKTIMACIGGVLLLSLLAGLYLWWPAHGKLQSALTFKRLASRVRFNYDLHKINGVYSLIFSFLLVISGILLELPDFFNPAINQLSPLYQAKQNQSSYKERSARIPLDDALNLASKQFPNATLRWIETPNGQLGSYRIQYYQPGEPSKRFPKTMVWVDQYSGQILDIRNPVNHSAGDNFLSWLHPLHNGEIAGLTGRWLVFALGFVPLVLYITGVIRWLQKRKAKKLKLT